MRFAGALVALICGALPCPAQAPAGAPTPKPTGHFGPQVAAGETATARFIVPLYERFDKQAAMGVVRFVDGFYRAPGNAGYNAALDHVRALLEQGGFGKQPGFELDRGGLVAGHGRGAVVQDHKNKTDVLRHGINQSRNAGMKKK